MSDLQIDSLILTGAAVATNIFILGYAILAPFYRSETGRASWVMTLAVALLLDVSLVAYWTGWVVPEWVARSIYVLIFCGGWMKLGALFHEQFVKRRRSRP